MYRFHSGLSGSDDTDGPFRDRHAFPAFGFAFAAARLMPLCQQDEYLSGQHRLLPACPDYVYENVEMPLEQYDMKRTERKEAKPLPVTAPIRLEHIDYRIPIRSGIFSGMPIWKYL